MVYLRTRIILIFAVLLYLNGLIIAQPKPGDVYRNYIWTTGDFHQKFLRVIGNGDYRDPVHFENCFPSEKIKDGWISLGHDVDLKDAIKAEIQIEKLLSHDGTKNLSIMFNKSDWITFPESQYMREPQENYLYHTYPTVEIPIEHVKPGDGNVLRFKVDSTQRFGMPQNILYGIFLRIYYEPHKTNIKANIDGIKYGTVVEDQDLRLINIEGEIKQVHYVGLYEDVNYQTDGNYRQWQYTYYRGKIQRHIGSASDSPYSVVWDTRWVPDQNKPFSISAIVEENNGLIKILDPVENLTLSRNYNILLCKPFNIPQLWATREGEFTHNFNLPRNPKQAEAFQLVLSTWSPGYFNGIYLNEWVVFTHEGNNYTPGFHRIELDKCHMLNWGINTIKTGKTPKVFDNMVHGTEVLYPGIMVLVRFPK